MSFRGPSFDTDDVVSVVMPPLGDLYALAKSSPTVAEVLGMLQGQSRNWPRDLGLEAQMPTVASMRHLAWAIRNAGLADRSTFPLSDLLLDNVRGAIDM